MAKKSTEEENNPTLQKIIAKLKEMGRDISYPIIVNTSNIDPDDTWITCNYMGTGLHIPINEIDFEDFRHINPEIMRHCATWSYIDKKEL